MHHVKDHSCMLDIRKNASESFSPVHHFCLLVDDTSRTYDNLKSASVELGNVGPLSLMPSSRTHFTIKGPYGLSIQFGEEMRMDDYVSDYVKDHAITE